VLRRKITRIGKEFFTTCSYEEFAGGNLVPPASYKITT